MKRKLITLFLTSFALVLTSCGTDTDKSSNLDPSTPSEPTPSSVVEYTVNETEFNAASNLRYKNLTYKAVQTVDGEEEGKVEMRFLADGSSHQVECAGWPELYFKCQADDSVLYIKKNSSGSWYVDQINTKTGYEEGNYGDDVGIIGLIDDLKNHYSNFTYDESTHSYSGTIHNQWANLDFVYVLKFEDKELASLTITQTYMGQTGVYTISIINRGTTVIDFDALNYSNTIYLANRTFTFVDGEVGSFSESENEDFIYGNTESTVTFNNDGTFSMTYKYDFIAPHDEQTYNGTYTFDKYEKTLSCVTTLYSQPYDATGFYTIDDGNVASGGYVSVNIHDTPLGEIQLSFKIA